MNRFYSRPVIERLFDRVTFPESGCWLWTGNTTNTGYGLIYTEQTQRLTHRVAYQLVIGPIPEGLELDHLCNVPLCLNPDHLEPVTQAENARRRGERQMACRRAGHDWNDPYNVRIKNGGRYCAECDRQRCREYQAKRRAA